ncbi:hypothetical protein N9L08_00820 [Rhodobacteraceae bacterium]|nr:hypothetical protein [Paracoccaceae bacterium]
MTQIASQCSDSKIEYGPFFRKISSWLGKDDVMNGVIIWSEHISKRAIIWCEDHGRLAFFKAEETLQGELFRKNQVFAY